MSNSATAEFDAGEGFPAPLIDEQRQFARKLRRRETEAEDVLWSLLRNRRLDGLKFRRQVPLLGYTVDFPASIANW